MLGDFVAIVTMLKGQPLAYNKDNQEDKECLFDAVDTLTTLLPPFVRMLETAEFQRDRMLAVMGSRKRMRRTPPSPPFQRPAPPEPWRIS